MLYLNVVTEVEIKQEPLALPVVRKPHEQQHRDHRRIPQPEPLRHQEQDVLAHDHREHLLEKVKIKMKGKNGDIREGRIALS